MRPAVANTTWHFLSHAPCRASERRWGCSQGRRERGARSAHSSSSSICLTLVLSCPAAGAQSRYCQAKVQTMLMPLSLAKDKSGKRKKLSRKTEEAASRGGTAFFSLPNPPGAPQTFWALGLWVTGQPGVYSSAAGAAGSAPSILLGHFCRLGLCPAWDAGREGNTSGLSPVRLKHSLYLARCGHAQWHPMHPQPAGAAALPASEASWSLVVSEHAQTVRPLKRSHTLFIKTCCCSVRACEPSKDRAVVLLSGREAAKPLAGRREGGMHGQATAEGGNSTLA